MGATASLPSLLDPLIWTWLCFLGACVGSYLNVCIFRIPRRCLSVFRPARSFCPRCRYAIPWHHNLPVVSWLALRGRCGSCAQPISARYPLVEGATAAAFGWLAARDLWGRLDEPLAWALFGVHAAFVCTLLVCTLIDLDLKILPDELTIPGILLAPLAALALPDLLAGGPPDLLGAVRAAALGLESPLAWWGLEGILPPLERAATALAEHPRAAWHLSGLAGGLLGAGAGAGFVWAIGVVFSRLLGRDSMGFGDVKYMGFIGGLVGAQGVVLTLVVACLAGSVGGLVYMAATGREQVTGRELAAARSPLKRLALWMAGARRAAAPEEEVRPRSALLTRLATGDGAVPFGPFLSLGALLAAFWPQVVLGSLRPGP